MEIKKIVTKKSEISSEHHHHNHLKDVESCCGDCKGNGACSRIKVDFNSDIFEAIQPVK